MAKQEKHAKVFGKTVKAKSDSTTLPAARVSKQSNIPFPKTGGKFCDFPLRKGQK